MLSASPPAPELPLTEPVATEQRVVDRMLARWDDLRRGRAFPSRADIERGGTGELEANLFLIAVGDEEIDDEVIGSGSAFRDALSLDPVGRRVVEILPSATEKGLSFCRTAAKLKTPIRAARRSCTAASYCRFPTTRKISITWSAPSATSRSPEPR